MLSSITWQQYLLAVTALALIYYIAVLFLYYRQDLIGVFNRKSIKQTATESQGTSSIMGEAKKEAYGTPVSQQEIQFAEPSPELTDYSPVN